MINKLILGKSRCQDNDHESIESNSTINERGALYEPIALQNQNDVSSLTRLNMKCIRLINVKMPTIQLLAFKHL